MRSTTEGVGPRTSDLSGSKRGDIEWNVGGAYGSISLCGYAQSCGLRVEGSGQVTADKIVQMNNGFDNLADSWIEGGKRLWIKPATVSNNLVGGWYVPDSYYLKTASNISATIHLQATGDLQSTNSTDNVSGLHGDGHGNWNTTTDTVGGGSLKEASYTLATLPTTNEQDGSHLWCSDCTLNGISGVEAYWHSSSKWTDSQNNTLGN